MISGLLACTILALACSLASTVAPNGAAVALDGDQRAHDGKPIGATYAVVDTGQGALQIFDTCGWKNAPARRRPQPVL